MSVVSYQTAIALKEAGLPQPTPQPGQWWWRGETCYMVCALNHDIEVILSAIGRYSMAYRSLGKWSNFSTFAPNLEYITAHLPPGFILEMWDGRHSCKIETEETTIRTMTDSFAEAAALVYLSLKQNAPGQTFVQPGDVAQE